MPVFTFTKTLADKINRAVVKKFGLRRFRADPDDEDKSDRTATLRCAGFGRQERPRRARPRSLPK